MVDDLNLGILNVAFKTKMFNKYGTFDQISNESMKISIYAYLHCDLLNRVQLLSQSLWNCLT